MKKLIGFILISFALAACADRKANSIDEKHFSRNAEAAPTEEDKASASEKAENSNVSEQAITSVAAQAAKDSNRKFIKTVDMEFRVKNVEQATYHLERLAVDMGGFVAHSHLASQQQYTDTKPISKDSVLESIFYVVRNDLQIRVPDKQLDSTLRQIAKWVEYLDHRTIDAQDVSIDLLANKLNQEDATEALSDANARKNVDEVLAAKQSKSQSRVENLRLNDRVKFSTISLHFYQREAVYRTKAANIENIKAYRPGFFSRLGDAFAYSWELLQDLVLGFFQTWFIWLGLGGLVWFIWWKRRK